MPEALCLPFFAAVVSGAIMFGFPFASVGAIGVTAVASPAAASAAGGDPVVIFKSALGAAVGFGVADPAEANVVAVAVVDMAVVDMAGAAGVPATVAAVVVDGAGSATGPLPATDRVRNTGMVGAPTVLPAAWAAIDRVRNTGAAEPTGLTGTFAEIGRGGEIAAIGCGGVGGIVTATA